MNKTYILVGVQEQMLNRKQEKVKISSSPGMAVLWGDRRVRLMEVGSNLGPGGPGGPLWGGGMGGEV